MNYDSLLTYTIAETLFQPCADDHTLVIGLGNPILGDDGVGWQVAEQVAGLLAAKQPRPAGIAIDCLAVGGFSLMEHLAGYCRAIIVDAVQLGDKPEGSVQIFDLRDLPNRALGHMSSPHDTTLHNALEVGLQMGVELPGQILVVGIEARNVYDFSEELSPAVAAAVPLAVQRVMELLEQEVL